jgi:uncharacterized protein (UPF0264 family)
MATQLLVSVRSAAEANAALAGGADILDVKEPAAGSLGRADEAMLAEIIHQCADRRSISVALGELRDAPPGPASANVRWAKVGLAGQRKRNWRAPFAQLARRLQPIVLVPVVYADAERADGPGVHETLDDLIRLGGIYLLIDTFIKDGRGLLHWLSLETLSTLTERCREENVVLGLAGALTSADIVQLLPLRPNIIAVRGAACAGGQREAAVAARRVRRLKRLVEGVPCRREPVRAPAGRSR